MERSKAYLMDIWQTGDEPGVLGRDHQRFEADGVKAIVEVGPGTTLSGLTKKTCPEIVALNVENVETLKETMRSSREL